jgi:hypothetical protein
MYFSGTVNRTMFQSKGDPFFLGLPGELEFHDRAKVLGTAKTGSA